MKEVTDLNVYNLAEELSDLIWCEFDKWDKKIQNTIGYQIIRSSDSISANLAEGFGRFSPADRKRFYRYSRGSFEETKTWLRKLIRRRIISQEESEKYSKLIHELGPKLNGFIRSAKYNYAGSIFQYQVSHKYKLNDEN